VLDFPRWKIFTIFATCLFFILLALPNFFSEEARRSFPVFLPSRTVSLGLDLQGGSYLLLELQLDRYKYEQLNGAVDSIRSELITRKAMYQGLAVKDGVIQFTLTRQPETGAVDMQELLRKVNPDLEVASAKDGAYTIGFSKSALEHKQSQLVEQSMQIVNRRVNDTGTREPIIQRQGEKRIILKN